MKKLYAYVVAGLAVMLAKILGPRRKVKAPSVQPTPPRPIIVDDKREAEVQAFLLEAVKKGGYRCAVQPRGYN